MTLKSRIHGLLEGSWHTGLTRRPATVIAGTTCQLLMLDRRDFNELLASDDGLRETVHRVAEERSQRLRATASDHS